MQNDPRSHGLWELTSPAAPATDPLVGETKAHVVVVGGGYTGLSTTLHLAEGGADVVLLEAVEIGFGGAGRNVGLVNAGTWLMPSELPRLLGPVFGERLLNALGNAPQLVFELIERHQIQCDVERSGTLHCAVGERGLAELKQRVAQWTARGAPVRLLAAAETAAKVGTLAYAGSILDLRAGTIQPLAYARGLARAAIDIGARIFTQSAAKALERTGQRWTIQTDTGSVSADWVVIATDAYTEALWPEIRTEQIHLPYFNFATQPLSDNLRKSILPERQGVWDTQQILSSFRFDRTNRLIFGSVGALRGIGIPIHRGWAQRALRNLFPHLGDVQFEAEWYGKIGMTDDHLPKFHKLAPNLVGFSGYNGRGIAPGTTFGRILARHIQGRIDEEALPLPLTQARQARFRTIRELYFEAGAQIAHFGGARL
jgi:glycine/D-amino acid oxidase-like deaminating enzyme